MKTIITVSILTLVLLCSGCATTQTAAHYDSGGYNDGVKIRSNILSW